MKRSQQQSMIAVRRRANIYFLGLDNIYNTNLTGRTNHTEHGRPGTPSRRDLDKGIPPDTDDDIELPKEDL